METIIALTQENPKATLTALLLLGVAFASLITFVAVPRLADHLSKRHPTLIPVYQIDVAAIERHAATIREARANLGACAASIQKLSYNLHMITQAEAILEALGISQARDGFTVDDVQQAINMVAHEDALSEAEAAALAADELADDFKPEAWYATVGQHKTLLAYKNHLMQPPTSPPGA